MAGKSLNISLNASLGPLTKALDAAAKMMVDFASSIEKTDKKLSDSIKTSVGEMKSALSNVQSSFDNTGKAGEKAGKAAGSLKQQIRLATLEAQKMAETHGEMSPQFIEAAKKAAILKDRMGDVAQKIDAMNPDAKFKAFGGVLQGGLGGLQAVAGAMTAFGGKSETAAAAVAKLQGLMSMSQGLNALGGLKDSFGALKTQITAMTTGMSGFGKAMMATGIGLLIAAVGYLAANWDKVMGAVDGVSTSQRKALEDANKAVKLAEKNLSIIEGSDNIYKMQGKSEREILGLKIAGTKEAIKAMEVQINSQKIIMKAQIAAAERNKGILLGILEWVAEPITMLLSGIDLVGKALGKEFGLAKGFKNILDSTASLIFDPKETKKKGDEDIAAMDKALLEMKNKQAGFINDVSTLNKKEADDLEKKNSDLKKAFNEQYNNLSDNYDLQKSIYDKLTNLSTIKPVVIAPPKGMMNQIGSQKKEVGIKAPSKESEAYVNQINTMNAAVSKSFEDTALLVGESIGKMFTGDFSGETFFSSVLAIIADFAMTIGKALIAYGFAMDAFKKAISNPYVAIAAGIALIAAGHIVKQTSANFGQKKPTKHAEGGIAYGNSFVNVGEYGNAHTNPEVIAPLSKLKDILGQTGGGRQKVEVYGSLYGSQLVMASSRSMANYRRINGRS